MCKNVALEAGPLAGLQKLVTAWKRRPDRTGAQNSSTLISRKTSERRIWRPIDLMREKVKARPSAGMLRRFIVNCL